MKKIKKFRIQPRTASVLRGLKTLMGETQTTPELEKAVEAEIQRARELTATAAVYDTLGPEASPAWAGPLWETVSESGTKPVAVTFFAATVGPGLEEELGHALTHGEGLRSRVLTSLGEESADQAAQFVCRLVAEEAKGESCPLSGPVTAEEAGRRAEILSALGADKVAIQVDGQGHLSPRFTRVGHILWYPPAKKGSKR